MKHQLDGQLMKQVSKISDTDWKKKVIKSETFEYLAAEYGGLKSIALIFMIEFNFRRRRRKDCIVT